MQKIKLSLALFCLIIFSIQTSSASYSVDEMAACAPVGDIAMKMVGLRKQGYEWKAIKTSVKEHLHNHLVLWVTPVAKLVISNPTAPSEKIVKQTIRFCLRTNKKHSRRRMEISI